MRSAFFNRPAGCVCRTEVNEYGDGDNKTQNEDGKDKNLLSPSDRGGVCNWTRHGLLLSAGGSYNENRRPDGARPNRNPYAK
jgi:hypothetical protein